MVSEHSLKIVRLRVDVSLCSVLASVLTLSIHMQNIPFYCGSVVQSGASGGLKFPSGSGTQAPPQ